MHPRFLDTLQCSPLDDGINWVLTAPITMQDELGDPSTNVTAPMGFITDFASIPPLAYIAGLVMIVLLPADLWAAWSHSLYWLGLLFCPNALAMFVILVADALGRDDRTDAGATIHDWCYRTRCCTRSHADTRLWNGMALYGVPWWKRVLIWGNVRIFGFIAWRNDVRYVEIASPPNSLLTNSALNSNLLIVRAGDR